MPIYSFALMLLFGMFVVVLPPLDNVWRTVGRRRRRSQVLRFRRATLLHLVEEDEFIFAKYISYGIGYLRTLESLVVERPGVAQLLTEAKEVWEEMPSTVEVERRFAERDVEADRPSVSRFTVARHLKDADLLEKYELGYRVVPRIKGPLQEFLKFLRLGGG